MDDVNFLVPPGPAGTLVKCAACENMFKKATATNMFCSLRCKRRVEVKRKRQRDAEHAAPKAAMPKGDVIWEPTQDALDAAAKMLLAIGDAQRGMTFGGPGVKLLKVPDGVTLTRSADAQEVYNMMLKTEDVPLSLPKYQPRSIAEIMKAAREMTKPAASPTESKGL